MTIIVSKKMQIPKDVITIPTYILHPEIQAAIFIESSALRFVTCRPFAGGQTFFYIWEEGEMYTRISAER